MSTYRVLAPLVQLKVKDAAGAWVFRQFYAGAVLDLDVLEVDEANLRSHVDSGQVVEQGSPVEVFAVPAGTPLPGKPPNVAVAETGDAATTAQPVPPLSADLLRAAGVDATGDEPYAAASTDVEDSRPVRAGEKPHGNASQTAWREYHVEQLRSQDVPEQEAREQAAGMSRDDIRALYNK